MDKFEYKVRADEIKDLISKEKYTQAAEIADTIDWRRVKSVMMLCTISDLYKINRRYEDARDILLLAYDRRPGGRTICYSLCELSIKMEEITQAKEYLDEFIAIAPKDPGRYILQYKLFVALDVSLEERIEVLQKLKEQDPRERWQYELAYLYHKVGLGSHCVDECDELILWFGEGKYVIKAMELKMLHQPLTPEQQAQYDEYKRNLERPVQQAHEEEQTYPAEFEEMPIQVKTMDVSQYNTINLQQELAADLEKVLQPGYQSEREQESMDPITRAIVEPLYDSDTESLDNPEIAEVSADDIEPEQPVQESRNLTEDIRYQTVNFGDLGLDALEKAQEAHEAAEAMKNTEPEPETEVFFGETQEISIQEQPVAEDTTISEDATRDTVMEQMRLQMESPILAEPPKFLAEVLSQESDGQISLVVPQREENVEKQITGQLNIEDILAEWERRKQENAEKRKEDVRQFVLGHTGNMFTEFEAAARDGLLEQLESGRLSMDHLEEAIAEELGEAPDEEPMEEQIPEETEETSQEENWETEELAEEPETSWEPEETEDAEESQELEEIEETEELEEVEEAEELELEEPEETEGAEEFEETEELEETEASEGPEVFEETEDSEESEEFEEPEEIYEAQEEVYEEAEKEAATESEVITQRPEVSRDKAKVRSLTREERDLFAPFIQSKASREQLIHALDSISMASYTGNLIITGDEGIDIITLAKNIVSEIRLTDSNFNGKVAKISGAAINDRDMEETLDKLAGGALIIHGAAQMTGDTIQKLHKYLQQENLGIIVILEDTKKAMDKKLQEYPILQESFTARIDVEALSNDILVEFGKKYALEMEYFIDDLGVLALHTKIESRQTSDHVVSTAEVKEIVDDAIAHVNRKTIGHFLDIVLAKRYDKDDMIILTEKDFA